MITENQQDALLWELSKVIVNHDCPREKGSCDSCPLNNYGTKRGDTGGGCGLNKFKDIINNYQGNIKSEYIEQFFYDGMVHSFESTPVEPVVTVPVTDLLCNENKCSTCPIEKECRKTVLGEKK
jgi:hypothetical protein